jgi:outer membrane protein OmpA-like peptidoglycan-associated protein
MSALITAVYGQNADQKWSAGLFGGKTVYVGDLGSGFNVWDPYYCHGAFQLGRYLSPSFDLGLQFEYGAYGFYGSQTRNFLADKTDGALLLRYKLNNGYLLDEDVVIAPFLAGGFGFASFAGEKTMVDDWDAFIPLGGGIKVNITPRLALQYQMLYNFTNGDTRDMLVRPEKDDHFISHSVGIVFAFGQPRDSDGDGINDNLDKCPGTPTGVRVNAEGCPVDGDGDGVPDYLDKCPNAAGIAAFSGCPDRDGDGIEDAVDKCPDAKGLPALLGCPDGDGDGISDPKDKCPNVKGLPEFNGCPDTDGDGITDADDRCPDAKGTKEMKGCPDKDGDGIADIDDRCPEEAGIAANRGCPEVKKEVLQVFTQALTGILFETGKDIIKPSSISILNNVVKIMNDNPVYNLAINGHTDNVGDDAMNLDLSQRRADAVKKYLADKGINPARMTSKGFGETMPVADNGTAAGRTRNRRVEFRLCSDCFCQFTFIRHRTPAQKPRCCFIKRILSTFEFNTGSLLRPDLHVTCD